jgi:uncharacterized membrane protein
VGTLIFDLIYADNADVLWAKGAAWLVTIGLVFAIIPRFINLGHVWFGPSGAVGRSERIDFWLNLIGIVAAIANAFIHSRDAYGIVPLSVILSIITVLSLSVGQVVLAFHKFGFKGNVHE